MTTTPDDRGQVPADEAPRGVGASGAASDSQTQQDQAQQDQARQDQALHDMGGDIGPTRSGSRGGGGLGPAEVRQKEELNDRLDRKDRGEP